LFGIKSFRGFPEFGRDRHKSEFLPHKTPIAAIKKQIPIIVINVSFIYGDKEKTILKSRLPKTQKQLNNPIERNISPTLLIVKAFIADLLA
jgi:hypothetical protein